MAKKTFDTRRQTRFLFGLLVTLIVGAVAMWQIGNPLVVLFEFWYPSTIATSNQFSSESLRSVSSDPLWNSLQLHGQIPIVVGPVGRPNQYVSTSNAPTPPQTAPATPLPFGTPPPSATLKKLGTP
jgi:hypothetical protein